MFSSMATEQLTNQMIRDLRDEAGCAGDIDMIEICDDALDYQPGHPDWSRQVYADARAECAATINDARSAVSGGTPCIVVP